MPVIPKGSRAQIVASSLKNSNLWEYIEQISLTTNMRIEEHSGISQLFFQAVYVYSNLANVTVFRMLICRFYTVLLHYL